MIYQFIYRMHENDTEHSISVLEKSEAWAVVEAENTIYNKYGKRPYELKTI